jgi:triphosphoribosyl-dephospho-CoA synthetase
MSANPCKSYRFDLSADSGPEPRRALRLADLAVEVLAAEAMLTPKPALVDGRGSGVHLDLDLPAMLKSASSLHGTFLNMADAAAASGREPNQALREQLARIGRSGERCMFAATGGSNAHRGAIWVLGCSSRRERFKGTKAREARQARGKPLRWRLASLPFRIVMRRRRIRMAHARAGATASGVRGARRSPAFPT